MRRTAGRTGIRRGAARGGRAALAGGLALAVAAGAAGATAFGVADVRPQTTDAAWATQEAGALTATAGQVAAPAATCMGNDSAPNILEFGPGDGGLEVTGYRVTITVDGEVPGPWQTGTTSDGTPFLAANATTDFGPETTRVAWGVASGLNYTRGGSVSVRALGPGGWESPPREYTWTISFGWVGEGYGSCTAA